MTKTYVYSSDTFDAWRKVTNEHSDKIGDISHRKSNSVAKAASIEQQYYANHSDVLGLSVAGVSSNSTVTITNSLAWSLRPGMKVVAYVGSQIVSDDYCAILSIVTNSSGAILTMNIPIVFGPSPNTLVFNFYRTAISDINDLETTKLNRNGDTMTEALTIDSLTSSLGELKTNEPNFNLIDTNATNVNFASAGSTINIGATSGTTTIKNDVVIIAQTGSGVTTINSPVVNISTGSTGVTTIISTKTSTNSSNGSFVVNGGTGILGTFNVAGVSKFENIADVTLGSWATGAVQLSGGLGVSKNVTIGLDLRVSGGDITIEGSPNIQAVTTTNPVGLFNTTTGLITIGASVTSSEKLNGNITLNSDNTNTVVVNGNAITTPNATFSIVNSNVTNLNLAGAATTINIGASSGTTTFTSSTNSAASSNGSVVFNGGVGIKGTLNVAGVSKFENIADVTLGSWATGATQMSGGLGIAKNLTIGLDLRVSGGDITIEGSPNIQAVTTTNPVGLFNTTTGLITIGASVATSSIINGNITLNSNSTNTVVVNGNAITTPNATFSIVNSNATNVNFAGAGTTINIGAASGTTTFASTTDSTASSNGSVVFNGGVGIKGTLNVAGVSKFENIADNTIGVTNSGAVQLSGGLGIAKNVTIGIDLRIKGGDITIEGSPNIQAVTTTNPVGLFNTTTGLITIGANNVSSSSINGEVFINTDSTNTTTIRGSILTTPNLSFNLLNTTATNISAFGAATTISIGASTGTTNVNNDLNLANGKVYKINNVMVLTSVSIGSGVLASSLTSVGVLTNLTVAGNTTLNNGNLITASATSNLFNTNATTLNIGGAATTISIGASTGTTNFNNDVNLATGKVYAINNALIINSNSIGSGVLASSLTSVGVLTNLTVAGNVTLNNGTLISTATTGNLFTTTATTVNIGNSATTISIGASTGTTNFNNDVNLATGKIYKISGNNVLTENTIGATVIYSSLTTLGTLASLVVSGNTTLNNGNLITGAATSNLFNTNATTLNIGGAATTINIGASSGTTNVNNTLVTKTVNYGTTGSTINVATAVSTTAETEIFQLDKTVYRSAEVVIQVTQGTSYFVTKFIMMQDGTDSYESEFGSLGTAVGTFNTSITGNVWSMKVTQSVATSTSYKIIITAVKI